MTWISHISCPFYLLFYFFIFYLVASVSHVIVRRLICRGKVVGIKIQFFCHTLPYAPATLNSGLFVFCFCLFFPLCPVRYRFWVMGSLIAIFMNRKLKSEAKRKHVTNEPKCIWCLREGYPRVPGAVAAQVYANLSDRLARGSHLPRKRLIHAALASSRSHRAMCHVTR